MPRNVKEYENKLLTTEVWK